MNIDPAFVVFSIHDLYEMANTIRYNIGSITSIALYVFLTVLAVFVVIAIIDRVAH